MSTIDNNRRIILTPTEISALYALPRLTQPQREQYFSLSEAEWDEVNQLEQLKSKLYLILSIGYFRVKPMLVRFRIKDVKEDMKYIVDRYYPASKTPRSLPSQSHCYYIDRKLLSMMNYQRLRSDEIKSTLHTHLADVATIYAEPRYVFDECLSFLSHHRVALPPYTALQKIVGSVLVGEQHRVESILTQHLPEKTKTQLSALLTRDNGISDLARIEKTAKDFSNAELQSEVNSHLLLKELYLQAKRVPGKLALSPKNLEYYSSLVHYYSITKLRRFPPEQAYLYVLCYLHFRYQNINDNLVAAFGYWVRKHRENAKLHARNKSLERADTLVDHANSILPLLKLFTDDAIADSTVFGQVRKRGFKVIKPVELVELCDSLEQSAQDKTESRWAYCDKHHATIRNHLRDVFLCLDLDLTDADPSLKRQLEHLKNELIAHGKITTMDQRSLPRRVKPYLCRDGEVNVHRYEWYLYQRLDQALTEGKVFVVESEKNKQLEDDLISRKDSKNRDKLILKTGLSKLVTPIENTLDAMEKHIQDRIGEVCANITQGHNRFVVIPDKADDVTWSTAVKKSRSAANNPFFNQMPISSIVSVLEYVDREHGFLDAFRHIATHKEKKTVSKTDLRACILANGTNYGVGHFAPISDRSFAALRNTEDSYVSLENLHNSNDIVANAVAELPIFDYYNVEDDRVYASIDGQKFETRINTFKARYSSKYFKDKGVSAMTLSCNHVALKTTIIGANEYEGHYAFDLLYNNTSSIQPQVLSSDTHGVNQVNFALLDLFGYTFAPRYAKFKTVFNDLFAMEVNGSEGELCLALKKPINRKLIIEEWNAIQRIICSLSRKTVTQSTLVKKLSNFSKSNRTLAALKEYDRLVKASYLLNYVDNQDLRRFVQQVLNKGEAYHQLRRKVASVNGDKFRGGSDTQVAMWNECARLIANCVIYFNSAILSDLLARAEKRNDEKTKEILCRVSPAAWRRINMNGTYDFIDTQSIELEELLRHVSTDSRYFEDALNSAEIVL